MDIHDLFKRILVVLALIGVIVLVDYFTQPHKPKEVKTVDSIKVSPLTEVVSEALEGTKGTYAVAIKNFRTQETYYLREHEPFQSGSLYKLWVMAIAFEKIDKGVLDKNEILSGSIRDLNNRYHVPQELAELTQGQISLTVYSAINQMITISHNYAAYLLTDKIKVESIEPFLIENGFSKSKVGIDGDLPLTTAYDVAQFYESLYKGNLASASSSAEMINMLKHQELNTALPKYLPAEISIAHKTGTLDGFEHDAGIVYTPNGDYSIVILSQSISPDQAAERIALISKAVYEYFTKN